VATAFQGTWELRYDPRVRKQLERVRNKAVARKLQEAAEKLAKNPYSGKSLSGYPGVSSKRVGTPGGEYRILYRPIRQDRVVFVVLIGPREEVYDLLKRKNV